MYRHVTSSCVCDCDGCIVIFVHTPYSCCALKLCACVVCWCVAVGCALWVYSRTAQSAHILVHTCIKWFKIHNTQHSTPQGPHAPSVSAPDHQNRKGRKGRKDHSIAHYLFLILITLFVLAGARRTTEDWRERRAKDVKQIASASRLLSFWASALGKNTAPRILHKQHKTFYFIISYLEKGKIIICISHALW